MKKHYLVDTNVIIDMLLDREDADAATTIFYSLRKILSCEDRINVLSQLWEAMDVAEVNSNVIDMALRSNWKDFEDAVQNFSAVADPEISAIVTRNGKDFKASTLEVVDSVDFLK